MVVPIVGLEEPSANAVATSVALATSQSSLRSFAPHLCLHSATKEKPFGKLWVGIIIALRFVRCVTTCKPYARNHTRLSAFNTWLRGPILSPKSFVPRSRQPPNSGIGYEDRAVCRSSPRSEGCLSAFRRGCDCNHADREFDFDDFVLTASLAQTAKPLATRSQRLCLRPLYVPFSWTVIVGMSKLGGEASAVSLTYVPFQCRWQGRPQSDRERIALARFRSSAKVRAAPI